MPQNQRRPGPPKKMPEPPDSTRLESDEEIQAALQARRARIAPRLAAAQPGGLATPTEVEAQPERPTQRPPIAMLCVLDDGKRDGEWIRLRADHTLIGRTEGDIRLSHDGLVSGRHAEVVRQRSASGFRWTLVDLQSTNGTFVRVGSTLLRHGNELLIGLGRYHFEAGGSSARPPAPPPAPDTPLPATQAWTQQSVASLVPSLVEITADGPVHRFALTLPEYWIGRDPQSCPIARPDDVLVNARHARLYRDPQGQWHIENNKSLNGVWLRITEPIPLRGACQFRAGEQRFLFREK